MLACSSTAPSCGTSLDLRALSCGMCTARFCLENQAHSSLLAVGQTNGGVVTFHDTACLQSHSVVRCLPEGCAKFC
jgi:hypothetical protein